MTLDNLTLTELYRLRDLASLKIHQKRHNAVPVNPAVVGPLVDLWNASCELELRSTDAESALLDMNNVKLYKQGKRLKLVVGSRFLSNERAFYVNEPYALTEAVGSVLTLVCEGRDLFEKIVFKMAFHQRISELFRDHKCMNRVIASAFE